MASSSISAFTTPLLTHLLAVAALPQSLPIPSLTHLSQHLPLFTDLLPAAAADTTLLSQGKLSTELGRTYFLANIATFAITGGMLARYGLQGARTWVKVVATLLKGVEEGWGRWAEGVVDVDDDIMDTISQDGSDDEEEPAMAIPLPVNKRKRQTRAPLPTNISSRLLSLGSTGHISTLAELLVSPRAASSDATLIDFASFTLSLLAAFKGTARWENILDGLLEGRKGLALTRRLWREGVRGKWSTDKDAGGWHSFQTSGSLS
jgi:ubiquitin-protein ligase E3 C